MPLSIDATRRSGAGMGEETGEELGGVMKGWEGKRTRGGERRLTVGCWVGGAAKGTVGRRCDW